MKKLLIAFIVAIASFSSAFALSYDYTSFDALEKSMTAQGVKEGLSEAETFAIIEAYSEKIGTENEEELLKSLEKLNFEDESSMAEFETIILAFSKKYTDGKTIKEMKALVEKDGTVIAVIEYDYSSDEAFEKSVMAQGAKEGLSEKEVNEIMGSYIEMLAIENAEELQKAMEGVKTEAEENAALLAFLKKHFGYTSLSKIKQLLAQD